MNLPVQIWHREFLGKYNCLYSKRVIATHWCRVIVNVELERVNRNLQNETGCDEINTGHPQVEGDTVRNLGGLFVSGRSQRR